MIIIKSIAIGKDVRIGFVKSGNIVPQAMTLRSIEIGRPKLYQAMDAVFAAMKKATGIISEKAEGNVQKVQCNYTQDNELCSYILSGEAKIELTKMKYKTEAIDDFNWPGLTKAVLAALEEAEQYIVGNRAQMKLDFQRADNHDE